MFCDTNKKTKKFQFFTSLYIFEGRGIVPWVLGSSCMFNDTLFTRSVAGVDITALIVDVSGTLVCFIRIRNSIMKHFRVYLFWLIFRKQSLGIFKLSTICIIFFLNRYQQRLFVCLQNLPRDPAE